PRSCTDTAVRQQGHLVPDPHPAGWVVLPGVDLPTERHEDDLALVDLVVQSKVVERLCTLPVLDVRHERLHQAFTEAWMLMLMLSEAISMLSPSTSNSAASTESLICCSAAIASATFSMSSTIPPYRMGAGLTRLPAFAPRALPHNPREVKRAIPSSPSHAVSTKEMARAQYPSRV